jgi:hypothetical protein
MTPTSVFRLLVRRWRHAAPINAIRGGNVQRRAKIFFDGNHKKYAFRQAIEIMLVYAEEWQTLRFP